MTIDIDEGADFYLALVAATADVCRRIAEQPPPSDVPIALSIWQVAREFLASHDPSAAAPTLPDADRHAPFAALSMLVTDWPELRAGTLTGEAAFARSAGLWDRLMFEPPMGRFASAAAAFVNRHVSAGQTLIELGAGIGVTSRQLVLPSGVTYIRTDVNPMLLRRSGLPGQPQRYNFDQPSPYRDADLVFSVNALHCARDHAATLRHIREMLRDGGWLVLSEGNPRTDGAGTPAVMDVVFSQFGGWWNGSGFRTREQWITDLTATGFGSIGYQRLISGRHDLGGLVWARRQPQ